MNRATYHQLRRDVRTRVHGLQYVTRNQRQERQDAMQYLHSRANDRLAALILHVPANSRKREPEGDSTLAARGRMQRLRWRLARVRELIAAGPNFYGFAQREKDAIAREFGITPRAQVPERTKPTTSLSEAA